MRIPRVIQITDETVLAREDLLARVSRMRPGHAVQLRDPQLSGRALIQLGHELRRRTRDVGARLVVNDRIDVALCVEADGVHLGRLSVAAGDARTLLPDGIITCSAHGIEEVLAAQRAGADAVLLSPIFASPGKGTPLGVEALRQARAAAPEIVVIALGGVTAESASLCVEAGAGGVASIRADLTAIPLSSQG